MSQNQDVLKESCSSGASSLVSAPCRVAPSPQPPWHLQGSDNSRQALTTAGRLCHTAETDLQQEVLGEHFHPGFSAFNFSAQDCPEFLLLKKKKKKSLKRAVSGEDSRADLCPSLVSFHAATWTSLFGGSWFFTCKI